MTWGYFVFEPSYVGNRRHPHSLKKPQYGGDPVAVVF